VHCTEIAGMRARRPLDSAAPAAVFAALERDRLAPLPSSPFVLAERSQCKISPDIHVFSELGSRLLPDDPLIILRV
jgi:hypothetical protein